jgi:glycosyltransferase involved in cell wall biosynthesis
MPELTALITCRNESRNIRDCLESVRWADEIFVVDSFSTDDTLEICRQYTDRIVQHEYLYPAAQKNWAIPQATYPWVLILDADERVTPALADEIRRIVAADGPYDGYYLKRLSYFLGRLMRYSGWQHDRVLRLFRRDHGRYQTRWVHESLVLDGQAGICSGHLIHYPYRDFASYLAKLQRYSGWSAYDPSRRRRRPSAPGILGRTVGKFLQRYLLQGGWLDGAHGLLLCMATAFSTYAIYTRRWEVSGPAAVADDAPALAAESIPARRPTVGVTGE